MLKTWGAELGMDTSPQHATTIEASGVGVSDPLSQAWLQLLTRNLNLLENYMYKEVICLSSGRGVVFLLYALLIN